MKTYHADTEATRHYYSQTEEYCDCAYCCNYVRAFPARFPEAADILKGLGLSHNRSLEIAEYGWNDTGDLRRYEAYYPVQGTLEEDNLILYDSGASITLYHSDSPLLHCPRPTMKEPYFMAVVRAELPWVLKDKI